jgi:hypothetical protein
MRIWFANRDGRRFLPVSRAGRTLSALPLHCKNLTAFLTFEDRARCEPGETFKRSDGRLRNIRQMKRNRITGPTTQGVSDFVGFASFRLRPSQLS